MQALGHQFTAAARRSCRGQCVYRWDGSPFPFRCCKTQQEFMPKKTELITTRLHQAGYFSHNYSIMSLLWCRCSKATEVPTSNEQRASTC